jgi:hypothetical protein
MPGCRPSGRPSRNRLHSRASGSPPMYTHRGKRSGQKIASATTDTVVSTCGQLARSLGTFVSLVSQARGLRHQSSSWGTQLSWVQTPRPHPTFPVASGFRWGLPDLLSTPLRIQQEISRVHHEGLQRNAVGGVLLNAPSPLWGSPIFLQGSIRLTWSPITDHPRQSSLVLTLHKRRFRLDGLTS